MAAGAGEPVDSDDFDGVDELLSEEPPSDEPDEDDDSLGLPEPEPDRLSVL